MYNAFWKCGKMPVFQILKSELKITNLYILVNEILKVI